ncbi:MAG: hypothetical protein ALECFALPRED_005037 [Alectoria fallacina]|uniref:Uncharacterized protein n=1 Tax=Alectoria fallacina TaxID=1903189 RepID=A0A8H3FSU3_9LECA|nr:MAG: hypothetical protein ALECFALPRED_005037 [Alectoria fallacina]
MQNAGLTSFIASLEVPTISPTIPEDADWLDQITLDKSDYDLSPKSDLDLDLDNRAEPADDDAALAAHLCDRDHASDLDGYEWHSDDLVSETYSDVDDDASDEEVPRLARIDFFERGIQREETWTREYRERWEEDHVFYKRKIQERLGDVADDFEEQSYVSESAWSARVDRNWGTPGTSSGGDQEPWIRPVSPLVQDENGINQVQEYAGTDENPSELSLRAQTLEWNPVSESSAHEEQSSTPIGRHLTDVSSITPSLHHGVDVANFNDISSLPQPTTRLNFKQPKRTSRFNDPDPILLETFNPPSNPPFNLPFNPQILDTFLDTCIAKTKLLLADAKTALASTPKVDHPPQIRETVWTRKKHRDYKPEIQHIVDPEVSASLADENDVIPADIVRVENWWKVRGRDAWWEV